MDDVDSTQERMDCEMALRIAAARKPVVETSEAPDGECANNCGDLPIPGGRYCSAECREDSDMRKQLRKRQGA